jgi:hypothetical protein
MDETISSDASYQVRRLGCYSADGIPKVCSIDWDRREIRVDRQVASKDFFELTLEAAAEFRAALNEAVQAVNDGGHRWSILCCDSNGNLEVCFIQARQGALHIGCGDADKPLWFFELRAEMINQFRVAFDEALHSVEVGNAGRGKETLATDAHSVELWSPGKEVPRFFALCEGVPPVTIAVGFSFGDCVKVLCPRRDQVITFLSAESARRSLAGAEGNVQLIWPDNRQCATSVLSRSESSPRLGRTTLCDHSDFIAT